MAPRKQIVKDTTVRHISEQRKNAVGGIEAYLKRIFAMMFGAVGVTALAAYLTIWGGGLQYLFNLHTGGMSPLYYILLFIILTPHSYTSSITGTATPCRCASW